MEFKYQIADIELVANAILKQVSSKTLLFYGEMGVGKTTLIKALCEQLGASANISSPTFSIVNEYEIQDGFIYHFDLYRIKDDVEALNFGIEDYLFSDQWVFIEWPDRLSNLLPDDANRIEMNLNEDGSRALNLSTETISTTEKK